MIKMNLVQYLAVGNHERPHGTDSSTAALAVQVQFAEQGLPLATGRIVVNQYSVGLAIVFVTGFVAFWRWSGTAISPAADISDDVKSMRPASDQSSETAAQLRKIVAPVGGPDGAKFVGEFRAGANHMYRRTPPINTVSVRAFGLECVSVFIFLLLCAQAGLRFGWIEQSVAAAPTLSAVLTTLAFLVALPLGMLRQVYQSLLRRAAALPVIDDRGRPKFVYLGDVPPAFWQYSPWLRASTWAIVAGASLIGAVILSIWLRHWFNLKVETAVVGLLIFRWLLTGIPVGLMIGSRA
jgi:hypothetical protein